MTETQIENAPALTAALSEFEFEEVATTVEERFRRAYAPETINAKVESQMEYDLVSLGWWLVIKRLGIGICLGTDKPAFETGDLLRISIRKARPMRENRHAQG